MKNIIIFSLSLIILTFSSIPSHASDLDPKWGQWMMYYYFHKDTRSVPDFINAFDKSGILIEKKGNIEAPLIGSLSQIFSQNTDKIDEWVKDDLSKEMENIIAVALLRENLEEHAPKFMQPIIQKHQVSKVAPISDINISTPADMDLMWGALLSSANPLFFDKIASVFENSQTLTGDRIEEALIRSSAQWSIESNMRQHVLVENLVKTKLKSSNGSIKEELEKILHKFEEAKKGLHFQKHDGDFSAGLSVVDPNVMEELKKASDQGLHVKLIKEAKRGDDVFFHIIFSGMELSKDYNVNVTYDLTIISPDDTIYYEGKNLEALVRRSPNRFSVFTSGDVIGIHFDPDDPFGTYKITSKITDHVSGKSLDFEQTVELVKQ